MAKHRRYSKKRNIKRNRKGSRKIHGGIGSLDNSFGNFSNINPDSQSMVAMDVGELDLSNPNLSISGNQSSYLENPPSGFLDSADAGDTTINTQDWSIQQENLPNFNNIEPIPQEEEFDLDDTPELDLSQNSDGNTTMATNISQGSYGGKRRKINKRKTNKRKTKKLKKTRKNRKRKQQGGYNTDTEELNPISYKEDEYDQMKNLLNWNPKQ